MLAAANVLSGVIQGSIVEPLIFLIYIYIYIYEMSVILFVHESN